ncbi:MAG: DEAD/DEAH box helicase family protein [Lachnospiraceae bacterium]|nr:DEAD/DEAH box helicase family protein [Lachnospiraceae bacterium]
MPNDFDVKEKRFEQDIEEYLITHGGYEKGDPATFNRTLGLDNGTFVSFIKKSQPKSWGKYEKIYGDTSEKQIVDRFCKEVKQTSLLNVLRHGFTDRGIKFRAVFWKPETSLNETSRIQYEDNILHCTRQLHYSLKNENSIDIVLFVNGIPVVSMELKCQFTGQNTANAINQYKFDRAGKDAIFTFKERVLVHFAVDLTNVYMTTRLAGPHTYFLPFDQGSNGAGKVGGKGNPNNENGYDTSYLWENVLCKDRLLEILQKYMHLQQDIDNKTGEVKSEIMIFPRYHQLDVVTKLLADVKENGSGKNYLIQHSAGSGKSNSIAWLAHRLSGLHNDMDEKIFQSVIIVTDRRVLDSQLQSTVYQFDHVEGVVQKIDKNSQQLKDAINGGAGIIITTLQKFPVIYKEVNSDNKRFAIIVDEAHSSQTGDAAKKLKRALADTEEILKEYAEMEEEDENNRKDDEDRLLDELAAQGIHENLSFFAFTATPKGKTLQMFGTKDAEGVYHPYHIYSMRQAIEEGFILDVLKNYMTYKMYYKILKTIDDDPELDTVAGAKAILNYETLHPHNISQKTTIMLEHFMNITRHKMGGRAKAMVVTPSRLHAVRYVKEFKRQIEEKGYNDLDVLVAFSGEITDDGVSYTEEGINKNKNDETIKEKALPEAFHTDDYNILVVAEKYQTGFDEPLLHTMFVDKKLSGVKAVQTLSRLNRTAPGKLDTFVLDFVNSADDIKASFEPFYEETVLLEATDPNVIYDMKNTLDGFRVYQTSEVEGFADIFYSQNEQIAGDLGRLQGQLRPAVDRFYALEVERQDVFKSTLAMFNRVYSYITQVCRLFDKDIHKFSVYSKFLYSMLPKGSKEKIDIDDKVLLEYYKLEKDYEGSIDLEGSEGGYGPVSGEAGHKERKKDPLTMIIEKINEKYGTAFTEMDKVLIQMENDYAKQEKWQDYAKNNDRSTFMLLFAKDFPTVAAERYEQNDEFFKRLFADPDMMKQVMDSIGSVLYERLRKPKIFDPNSGVIEEATPETYVEDIYVKPIR